MSSTTKRLLKVLVQVYMRGDNRIIHQVFNAVDDRCQINVSASACSKVF